MNPIDKAWRAWIRPYTHSGGWFKNVQPYVAFTAGHHSRDEPIANLTAENTRLAKRVAELEEGLDIISKSGIATSSTDTKTERIRILVEVIVTIRNKARLLLDHRGEAKNDT